MATNPLIVFLQQLRRSALLREGAEQTDGQLLEAFVRRRDSQALEGLVERHAPMVWDVCRRKLANHHDAEDAFQATFLVLVRKAASIRSRELLANWLYGVAQTTACKARQMAAKRSTRERQVSTIPEQQTEARDPDIGPELRALLDEELSRLPEKFRVPIVLCDLEGRSRPDVAQQLRLPEGTVGSRLARGRALLARRLARRGLGLSAASLAVVLPQQAASGSVPAALLSNTIQAATLLTDGDLAAAGAISAQVSTLTEGVLKTMTLAKKKAAGVVLLIAALVVSGGMGTYHLLASQLIEPGDRTSLPDTNPAVSLDRNEAGKPVVNPDADIKRYGSEADAKRRAVEILAARDAAIPGLPEVEQQSLLHWREPTTNRSLEQIPRSQIYGNIGILETKLDREKGQWTVIGVREYGHPPPGPAWEVDWKFVFRYTPSTGSWETVSCEGGTVASLLGEPQPFRLLDGQVFYLPDVKDPARCGWRPVGKKDDKGGGR
jgi:RNA polymerase sigma factor (sigma-70 family)